MTYKREVLLVQCPSAGEVARRLLPRDAGARRLEPAGDTSGRLGKRQLGRVSAGAPSVQSEDTFACRSR